jgi:hypothetical protein
MAIIDVNWNPNRKDLRVFGIGALVATSILSALFHFRKGLPLKYAAAIVAFGLIIFISTLILPKLARIIYVVMVALAFPIGMVLSFVLMALFYYLILTPIGLVFRLMGRDLLDLKYKKTAESYWVKRRPPQNLKRYFHQF